jgi:tetratricopeptide (TPR) repeat protein
MNKSEVDYLDSAILKSLRGDKASAINDFNKAIEINPNNFIAYLHRGDCKVLS